LLLSATAHPLSGQSTEKNIEKSYVALPSPIRIIGQRVVPAPSR
jgi:hypothetical protein